MKHLFLLAALFCTSYLSAQPVNLSEEWDKYQKDNYVYSYDTDKLKEALFGIIQQFSEVEEFNLSLPYTFYTVYDQNLTPRLPLFPNLRTLTYGPESHRVFADLSFLQNCPKLESIRFLRTPKEVDGTDFENLSNLTLLSIGADYDDEFNFTNMDKLPTSLKQLKLGYCECDLSELSHLNLDTLEINYSENLTAFPPRASLESLKTLDVSYSSVEDLSLLKNLPNLEVFCYSGPSGLGNRADFSVIATLPNLKELELFYFPKNERAFAKVLEGRKELDRLAFFGSRIRDLSCLEGITIRFLEVPAEHLEIIPSSVLSNPELKSLRTGDLEVLDEDFEWQNTCQHVETLFLEYSEYCDFANFAHMPLKTFKCPSTDCVDNVQALLAFAPTLEKLTLDYTVYQTLMQTCSKQDLQSFSHLKKISLKYCNFNTITSCAEFKAFPALEEVSLNGWQGDLSENCKTELLEMKGLNSLKVKGNFLK
ncbi:MAG: hypothetical protein SP1CHLAM54_02450 [Chlamydiia bacterium]|nr:hypothetical protein [Chlamydiia bacterium]MCH9615162.1 hypothetical protein [Chlamydiia bacterium]MCH9628516.1 hypothetical protein [Chlamydiia bacterium]